MKKLFALILAVLMILATFAACSKPTANNAETPTNQIPNVQTDDNNGVVNGTDDSSKNESNTDDALGEDENNDSNKNDCDHEGGDDATCVTESICDICGEPYGGVDAGNHEGEEEWVSNENTHKMAYSCCGEVTEDESEHSFVNGTCSECEYKCAHTETDGHNCKACKAFVKHNYQNGTCTVCGLNSNGSKITFGSYPQSKVTGSLVTTLNGKSVAFTQSNGMWYADVEEGGNKYRGVRATANGTASWFVYEPIKWTVVSKDSGKALVLCDMIIDAQKYADDTTATDDNNYADSYIRAWLNADFIETAFNELQREVILVTAVSNSDKAVADYNSATGNPYLCEDTEDKIFLLSKAEIKNGMVKNEVEYNYLTDASFTTDASRQKQATAYAIAQINGGYDATNGAWWWLRTPYFDYNAPEKDYSAHVVKVNGSINMSKVDTATGGVAPAMWIYI